jgi:hypothetical protein
VEGPFEIPIKREKKKKKEKKRWKDFLERLGGEPITN